VGTCALDSGQSETEKQKSIRAAMRSAMLVVGCPCTVKDFAGSFSSSGKVVGRIQARLDYVRKAAYGEATSRHTDADRQSICVGLLAIRISAGQGLLPWPIYRTTYSRSLN